eukprot:1065603-Amphidinium_carterae.2
MERHGLESFSVDHFLKQNSTTMTRRKLLGRSLEILEIVVACEDRPPNELATLVLSFGYPIKNDGLRSLPR